MYTKHTKNTKIPKKSDYKVFDIARFTPAAQAHMVEFTDFNAFMATAQYCKAKTFFKDASKKWYFFSEILLYIYDGSGDDNNGTGNRVH